MITHSNQIELRHLKYFIAVAEELHFRKAADRLFISQPGLSRQITQLEEMLGVTLFQRTKRSVRLTSAGVYLKDEAQSIVNRLEVTFDRLKTIERGEEGEVRIGFVGSAMQEVIPQSLLALNEVSPDIHTSLNEMTNWDQVDAIAHDKLDIGFVRLNHAPEGFEIKTVYNDTFSLVLPSDHPLDEGSFKDLSQLKDEAFILFSSDYSYGYYEQIISLFEESGFSPRVSHRSVHANTIFRLVENKLGISIVPTTLQDGFSLNVKFIELKSMKRRAQLSAIWKTDNPNPALKRYLEVF
ncbi:MAG: LysR family transcriptional regulator [Bacteroidota bacterium]